MAAPNAPIIHVRSDGIAVYVRWQPVPDATDYDLYFSEAGGAFGIESQFEDSDIGDDGWFFYISAPYAGIVDVKMKALNAGAEASGYSNDVQVNLMGGREVHPTSALDHIRKGAWRKH